MDFLSISLQLLSGFGETLKIFSVTLLAALPLGLLICFGAMARFLPLRAVVRALIWAVRGTPLMLQLIIVYYGPGLVFGGVWFSSHVATYLTFSLNYACYFAEIYRGAIAGVPAGQYEAGQVLGMSRTQVFFRVILLQMLKRMIAPIGNEIITLVKDTSLARIITYYELIHYAQSYIKNGGLLWPLFYTGVFYLVFTACLTWLFNRAEKRLAYIRV